MGKTRLFVGCVLLSPILLSMFSIFGESQEHYRPQYWMISPQPEGGPSLFSHPGLFSYQMKEPNPQILIIPRNLSFPESYWRSDHGKRVTITINNPFRCHIIYATIKLIKPIGWEINPDVTHPFVHYDPHSELFWIKNFGNLKENSTNEWFEIKPGPHVAPGNYDLYVNSTISFYHGNPNLNRTINLSEQIDLEVIGESQWYDPIKEKAWVFIIIAAVSSVVGLILTHISKVRDWWHRIRRS